MSELPISPGTEITISFRDGSPRVSGEYVTKDAEGIAIRKWSERYSGEKVTFFFPWSVVLQVHWT